MAIPTKIPEWDTTQVNSVEVDQQHKDEGWLAPAGVPEKPPFQSFNWWQNLVYQWVLRFKNVTGGLNNLTELLSFDETVDGTSVNVRGYYTPNDEGGGTFNYDSTINKSTANGGTIIDPSVSLALQGTGVGNGVWVRQYEGSVNPKWYGARGNASTDDSAIIQTVFNLHQVVDFTKATYFMSSTVSPQAGSVIRFNGAQLLADPALTTPLFKVLPGTTNCNIYDMRLNGNFSTNINYLLDIVNCQFNNFYNTWVANCDIGVNCGDQSDDINSENNFFGLNNFECVTVLQTQGLNTQIFLNGCIAVGTDNIATYGKTTKAIINRGGAINIENGACQTPNSTGGFVFYFEPTSYLSQPSNTNIYGKITAINVGLETAGAIAKSFDNGIAPANITKGALIINACTTFTTNNTLPLIELDAGFQDMLDVNSCRFISPAQRTVRNILINNNTLPVNTDKITWSNNFLGAVDGCTGGILLYETDQIVLNATGLTSNTLVNNTYLSLVWDTFLSGDRHQSDFDGTSFTVPAGGFSNLKVDAYIELTESAAAITGVELEIVINGTNIAVRNLTPGSIGGVVYASIQGTLKNLVAGDEVKIRAKTHGAGATGTVNSTFRISATV